MILWAVTGLGISPQALGVVHPSFAVARSATSID